MEIMRKSIYLSCFILTLLVQALLHGPCFGNNTIFFQEKEDTFYLLHDNAFRQIKPQFLDSILRKVKTNTDLEQLVSHAKIVLTEYENGEKGLQVRLPFNGGGPATASAGYWVTKAACYVGSGILIAIAEAQTREQGARDTAAGNGLLLGGAAALVLKSEALVTAVGAYLLATPTP